MLSCTQHAAIDMLSATVVDGATCLTSGVHVSVQTVKAGVTVYEPRSAKVVAANLKQIAAEEAAQAERQLFVADVQSARALAAGSRMTWAHWAAGPHAERMKAVKVNGTSTSAQGYWVQQLPAKKSMSAGKIIYSSANNTHYEVTLVQDVSAPFLCLNCFTAVPASRLTLWSSYCRLFR